MPSYKKREVGGPGISGEEQVDGRSRHERTVVATMKEAAIFDCGHVVIDFAYETTYR